MGDGRRGRPGAAGTARRWAALVVVAALGTAGVAGCSDDGGGTKAAGGETTASTTGGSGDGSTSTTTAPAAAQEFTGDGDFYAVPDPLPGAKHGDLIRYQRLDDAVVAGATAYRIMYRSESLAGDPIAVTGTGLVPDAAAPEGGRRMLTMAHGTTGVADQCTPSKKPGGELLLTKPAVEQGWLVAMTDYEGLGTPGRHPYLVGESEGRSVIDAIVAAAQLPDADAGHQLAIAGYSQGGHGALFANQVAKEWAPDLEVVGTFAGAPATEPDIILAAAPALPLAGGFAFLIVAGFAAAYPDLDLADFLTPAGVERLDTVDKGCVRDVVGGLAGQKDLIRPKGPASPAWKARAAENVAGQVDTPDPILIIHSKADEVVPISFSQLYLKRACGHGQVVERRVLDAGTHVGAAPGAYAQAMTWLADRFDAKPGVVDSCTTLKG